jgi:8-oxo-dGTP pyrophosphatase MutT (NUDIX family)
MLKSATFKSFIHLSYQIGSYDAINKLSFKVYYAKQTYENFIQVLDIPDLVAHNIFMASKTKKAQIVLAVLDDPSHSFHFLLLQTNEHRGSFWQNVTGKIEENETIEEGGLREAIEETQLKIEDIVDIINLGLVYEFIDQKKRNVYEESFLIVLDKKWNVKIDPHEHQAFKWVPLTKINRESVKHLSNYETLEKSSQILRRWGRS